MICRVVPAFEVSPPPREMSRGEIGQLRRGELRPDEAAVWLARTRGLTAPVPPADGDLPPNGTGWLLGFGTIGGRLHPRLGLAVACCAGAGVLVALWADLLGWRRPPWLALALLGALVPLVASCVLRFVVRWGLRRRFVRGTRPGRLAEVGPGTLVRVTGVIAAQPVVPTLFSGAPAVLFRSCIANADEVRGIDFELELDGGQQARVCVRGAFLVDRPTRAPHPPACGPVYAGPAAEGFRARLRSALLDEPSPVFRTFGARHESSVGPGDRVEVAGVLQHELAPEAAGPFDRGMPTRFVLRAGPGRPLLVRSCARDLGAGATRTPGAATAGRGAGQLRAGLFALAAALGGSSSHRSPKKPASTILAGWRLSGAVLTSSTAQSGSLGIWRALFR
jgi:hypothetical protein